MTAGGIFELLTTVLFLAVLLANVSQLAVPGVRLGVILQDICDTLSHFSKYLLFISCGGYNYWYILVVSTNSNTRSNTVSILSSSLYNRR